ncbi:MAG: branched-chain amino acid ABC transporter permease [Nitriliruptorales bacterium]|nr:branched-chain amino acid ABC transporter permease [Nitriliruptorales bacterium]
MGFALVDGIFVGTIYGLFAVGLVLVYNGSRVINFAQAELGTLAVYLTWTFTDGRDTPRLAAAIAAIVIVAVIGLAFERAVISPLRDAQRITVAVATVGMSLFLVAIELLFWGASPRNMPSPFRGGVTILGFVVNPIHWIALGSLIVLSFGLAAFLKRTDFGLGVLASAQDPSAARLVGVRFADVSAFTWVLAAVLGALAALLVQPRLGGFGVGFMTNKFFVPALAAALVGGLRSVRGAFLGGIAVGLIDSLSQYAVAEFRVDIPGVQILALFLVILLVLLVRPQGLLGQREAS